MPDSYVCSGAMMRCTMGTSPANLMVLPTRTVFLAGQRQANISDHKSMVNLKPFGLCRSLGFPATAAATAAALGTLTPMPCVHNTPAPWFVGKMDYLIQGQPALLKSCKCQCMWGGTISLITDGQVGEGTQYVQKKPKEKWVINNKSLSESNNAIIARIREKAFKEYSTLDERGNVTSYFLIIGNELNYGTLPPNIIVYNITNTVALRFAPERLVPIPLLDETIKHPTSVIPDPQGTDAMLYCKSIDKMKPREKGHEDIPGKNKEYLLEVLYHPQSNTIMHFVYKNK